MMRLLIIAVVSWFLILPADCYGTSPLRMCDSIACKVQLHLINNQYNISVPIQIFAANPLLVVCWRQRPVVNGSDNQCSLDGYDSAFACLIINIQNTAGASLAMSYYTSDAALTSRNVTTTDAGVNATLSSSLVSFTISQLQPSNIYQGRVGRRVDLGNDPNAKSIFFHTFTTFNQTTSDNLIMQRNFQCFQFYQKDSFNYNLVFYGGTVRDGLDTMYFHVLSYLSNTSANLNMWGGISYSKSHATRDMLGFSSGNGHVFDLYSLYFGAPFEDTSINVKSTNDVQSIASSYPYTYKDSPYYYYMGVSRLYDTTDAVGDEIIRKKMGGFFCYAVAYSSDQTAIMPNDSNYQHSYSACWNPDITVWQQHLSAVCLLSLFVFVFIL